MNWKLTGIAAAMMSAGLMAGGTAQAQTIDGTPCENFAFVGLGNETCALPNPTPGEGVLFTAAEQVVSIVSAIADDIGCPAVALGGAITVKIDLQNAIAPYVGITTIGTAKFNTTQSANSTAEHNGVRQFLTSHNTTGKVVGGVGAFGDGLTALVGTYVSDGPYSIMHGDSDFTFNGSLMDERVIKDFYQGIPAPSEIVAGQTAANTRVIRDNGLEVTTKKAPVPNLAGAGQLTIGHPKGKWRQTSFYRGPDGAKGKLTYTKVRIAPFGNPECALQLTGDVNQSLSFPDFDGKLTVFPLVSVVP